MGKTIEQLTEEYYATKDQLYDKLRQLNGSSNWEKIKDEYREIRARHIAVCNEITDARGS